MYKSTIPTTGYDEEVEETLGFGRCLSESIEWFSDAQHNAAKIVTANRPVEIQPGLYGQRLKGHL